MTYYKVVLEGLCMYACAFACGEPRALERLHAPPLAPACRPQRVCGRLRGRAAGGKRLGPRCEPGRDAAAPSSAKRLEGASSIWTASEYKHTASRALTAFGSVVVLFSISFRRETARGLALESFATPSSFIKSHLRVWCQVASRSANSTPFRRLTSSCSNSAALMVRLGPCAPRQARRSSGTENSRSRGPPRCAGGPDACRLLDVSIFSFHFGDRSMTKP
mmetsp:Transcript_34178/g.106097  ORF Transcript_34178/g.106097 Transcript_34178/m.106097 type:complete len:220 (+) Transcript_34178:86-745(+)